MVTAFHQPVRCRSLCQGKGLVNDRLDSVGYKIFSTIANLFLLNK